MTSHELARQLLQKQDLPVVLVISVGHETDLEVDLESGPGMLITQHGPMIDGDSKSGEIIPRRIMISPQEGVLRLTTTPMNSIDNPKETTRFTQREWNLQELWNGIGGFSVNIED